MTKTRDLYTKYMYPSVLLHTLYSMCTNSPWPIELHVVMLHWRQGASPSQVSTLTGVGLPWVVVLGRWEAGDQVIPNPVHTNA